MKQVASKTSSTLTVKTECFSETSTDFQRTPHSVISQKIDLFKTQKKFNQYGSRAYKGQITTYIIKASAEHTLLNVQSKQGRYHVEMKADSTENHTELDRVYTGK
jgi:hypothetical protein